jgi:hypothetical protein
MKECFSCQKNAPQTTKELLSLHKKIYEQKGIVFWFYKESEKSQIKIADDTSFKNILPKIKDNDGAEWCHISEFGNATNDNVFENTSNQEPEIVKPKSKSKRVRKPLDKTL